MKKKITVLSSLLTSLVAICFIAVSCSSESIYDEPDTVIADSPELEDYIIAATDLDQTLKLFEQELNRIDFSKLETVIEDGREVTYLPESIPSLNIDQKILLMQERRGVLLRKYPEFTQGNNGMIVSIDNCIKQSVKVTDFLLKKNINIHQSLTRFESNENYGYDSMNALIGQLYNWCLASDYVEVAVFVFTDGTSMIYRDAGYSSNNGWFPTCYKDSSTPGVYYYPQGGKAISYVAHTHRYSSQPSDGDVALKSDIQRKAPGLPSKIYYNGAFHSY